MTKLPHGLLILSVAFSSLGYAQQASVNSETSHQSNSASGWQYRLGLGVEYEREYSGSSENDTELEPIIQATYRDTDAQWEFTTSLLSNQFRGHLSDHWVGAAWLNFEQGREESDSSKDRLDGLGKIDDSIELGLGLMYLPTDRLTLFIAAQTYASDKPSKGTVGFIGGQYALIHRGQWALDIGVDISFADSDHLQTEFGITDEQARNSIYQAHSISSGLKSYGASLSARYKLSKHWEITSELDYEVLSSKVADSPLVKAGDDTEIEFGIGISYLF